MGVIYLDSCLLIYLVEGSQERSSTVQAQMRKHGSEVFATSPLAQLECFVGPFSRVDPRVEAAYRALFASLRSLPLSTDCYLQAARLRAHHGLKTPDALHLACAMEHGCTSLWTNDDRLSRASLGLATRIKGL